MSRDAIAKAYAGLTGTLTETRSLDPVNPAHYKDLDPEPIAVIEKWGLGYHLGQVVKYVARAGKKVVDGDARQSRLLDLRKARWYLDREVARTEGEQA